MSHTSFNCPYCWRDVPVQASVCGHCTRDLVLFKPLAPPTLCFKSWFVAFKLFQEFIQPRISCANGLLLGNGIVPSCCLPRAVFLDKLRVFLPCAVSGIFAVRHCLL